METIKEILVMGCIAYALLIHPVWVVIDWIKTKKISTFNALELGFIVGIWFMYWDVTRTEDRYEEKKNVKQQEQTV